MPYKAFLSNIQEYHGSVQVVCEFKDAALQLSEFHSFTYSPDSFSVAQAKTDILAYRDKLNALPNKIAQLRAFIGQEVT
jgi:hypothetical protein